MFSHAGPYGALCVSSTNGIVGTFRGVASWPDAVQRNSPE